MSLKLEDNCKFINGGSWTSKEYSRTGYPVLKVSNFNKDSISFNELSFLKESSFEKYKKNQLKLHDIIIATVGSHPSLVNSAAGRCITISKGAVGLLLNQNAVCLRSKDPEVINQRYLGYLCKSQIFQHFIQQRGKGAANQMRIPISGIKSFVYDFPKIETQRKIATILSAYDDLIENNLKRIKLLEEKAQLTYEEWFVRMKFPGHETTPIDEVTGLPVGWEKKSFPEIANINPRTKIKKGIIAPYVPMSSISESSMVIYPIEERSASGGTKFKNGDTLFARITPCLENGKTGFVQFMKSDEETATGSTEYIVFRESEQCGKYFNYCISRSEKFRQLAIKSMVGSDGRQRVKPDCFEKYFINHAPKSIRIKFENYSDPIFKSIQLYVDQNQLLKEARNILLPRFMTGMIDVEQLSESGLGGLEDGQD